MSELFDWPSASQTTSPSATAGTALVGKEGRLHLLAGVSNTLAFAAESGEELDEINRGSLSLQVRCFVSSPAVVACV